MVIHDVAQNLFLVIKINEREFILSAIYCTKGNAIHNKNQNFAS